MRLMTSTQSSSDSVRSTQIRHRDYYWFNPRIWSGDDTHSFHGSAQQQQKHEQNALLSESLREEWGDVTVHFPADFAEFQHPPEDATIIKACNPSPDPSVLALTHPCTRSRCPASARRSISP